MEDLFGEIKAIQHDLNRVIVMLEGSGNGSGGIRTNVRMLLEHQKRQEDEFIKLRSRLQTLRVVAAFLFPVIAMTHQFFVISDLRHMLNIPAGIAAAGASIMLVSLIACMLFFLLPFVFK